MKKTFTLITLILLSLSLFAGIPQTRLTVSTNSKTPITILVDGRSLNNQRDNNNDDELVINNLPAGYHNIKIYQKKNARGWGNKSQVVYDGNVYIKQQYHVDITVNRFGKAFIDERQITRDNYDDYNDNAGGQSYPGNQQYPGDQQYPGNPYPNGQQYPNNTSGGYNNNQAMNARSFDQLRYTLANTSYENSRLSIAKQNISQNYFSVAQVKAMMQLFSYEANKLDLAKLAYQRTTDKQNFYSVNDAFAYNSSKEELTRYIQQSGN